MKRREHNINAGPKKNPGYMYQCNIMWNTEENVHGQYRGVTHIMNMFVRIKTTPSKQARTSPGGQAGHCRQMSVNDGVGEYIAVDNQQDAMEAKSEVRPTTLMR